LHEDLDEGNGVADVEQSWIDLHVIAELDPDFPVSSKLSFGSTGCKRRHLCQQGLLVCGQVELK
jgi:hypothetical protein